MNVFELFAKLSLDTSEYENGLDDAEKKGSSFGSKIGTVAKGVVGVSSAITTTAISAVGGLAKWASQTASNADEIDKMSIKLGISREAYQQLDYIMSQNGGTVDSFKAGMNTLRAKMSEGVDTFADLGVAIENEDGSMRDSEEVMWETISALQEMDNATEQAVLAKELFGKAGTDMLPLLQNETTSVEEYKKQAEELGLVIGDDLVDDGVAMNDAIDQVTRMFESLSMEMSGDLMPIFSDLLGLVEEMLPTFKDIVDEIAPLLVDFLEAMSPFLSQAVDTILPVIVELASELLPVFTDIVSAILPVVLSLFEALSPFLMELVDKVLPIVVDLITAIAPILEPIIGLLTPLLDIILLLLEPLFTLIELVLPPVTALIELLAEVISTVLTPILEGLEEWIGTFVGWVKEKAETLLGGLMDKLKEWFTNMSSKLKEKGTEIKNKIKNWFSDTKNKVTEFFTNFKEKVTSGLTNAYNTVRTKLDNIKEKFTSIFDNIKKKVQEAIDKVKSIFDGLSLKLPHIDLPHFSISGSFSLDPPSIPSIGVSWYAKAMDGGMILNQPTIFGALGNQLLGAGEVGAEAIVGVNSLRNMIKDSVESSIGNIGNNVVINVYGAEGQDINELAEIIEQKITANTRRMANAW